MDHPHEQLSDRPHDRLGEHRRDETWLEERWADPETRVLVVSGTRIRPSGDHVEWVSTQQAPPGDRILLGEQDGRVWFAVVTDTEHARTEPDAWLPLRGVLPQLAKAQTSDAPLVMHALGIAEWLLVTRFCPRDGGVLELRRAGHELRCTGCGRPQFPRLDPAVIMLITTGEAGAEDERCLLGRQRVWPQSRFSTLAGFCEPGESLEDAVRREVAEEVGIAVGEVTYFGNQPWPLPSSLMVGFTGRATSTEIRVDEDEIEEARWLTRAQMREQVADGSLLLPGGVSISHSLVESWYGGPLPGRW